MVTELGKILRIIRINTDESGRSMAEKFGISAAYLSAIEMGKRSVPQHFEDLIFKYYELSEHDKIKVRDAVMNSSEQVKIDLTELTDKKKRVIFALKRGIDEATLDLLCEIIDDNDISNIKEDK